MKRRLKVVHLVVAGQIGGAERLLVDLASRPEESGADHSVALMTPNPALRKLFSDAGLDLIDRGLCPENPAAYLWRSYGPSAIRWLIDRLNDKRADILHVHTFGSHTLGVRAGRHSGIPVVRTEHGPDHYSDPTCAILRRWTLVHTDRVVAVSDFIRRVVIEYEPRAAEKTETVRNGINLARFAERPSLTSGPFTFSMTCRLEPVKQVHLAIEAVSRVPGTRLVVAGDGSERARLQALINTLGIAERVSLLGFQDDVTSVLAASDAAINCSRHEPMSLAILEAMAIGRPVIAFANGGTPEIIQDGATGWLVGAQTINALADGIQRAASDRDVAASMGDKARRRVESAFGLDRMCSAYGRVYEELV